jgi:uncharacterized protein YcbX
MTARVSWISFTPVKALALEQVEEIDLLETGPRGDRRFYFVDEHDRLVNNKGGRRGPLQLVHARFDDESEALTLRLADGRELTGRAVAGDELQTSFHKRPKPARLVAGPWDETLSELVGEPLRLVAAERTAPDRGRGGAVTMLGVASLGALAGELGVAAVDGRRFRMNFGVDGLEPHGEDAWLGRRIAIGEAVVVPQGHVGRCAITTQNPDTGVADLDTLNALAAYRGDVEATEPLPFGVHAAVASPGRVRVGDLVEPF